MGLQWTYDQDKVFESALAKHYNDADRWNIIAALLPTKTSVDVQQRYRVLEADILKIESGSLAGTLPNRACNVNSALTSKRAKPDATANGDRRKGMPWSEEEHRLFLLGLGKFGKGDWRSIARNFVITRTPTQVASHAQKYFIRLNTLNKKDKRRASIHDITSVGGNSGTATHQNTSIAAPLPSQLQLQQQHSHMLQQGQQPLQVGGPPPVGLPLIIAGPSAFFYGR
ncbi:MAG: hypothetical protein WDW36_005819 [Sanguina aurantia]